MVKKNNYRKSYNKKNTFRYVHKELKRLQPEKKNIISGINVSVTTSQLIYNVCNPTLGVLYNSRIGDIVKAVSYYGMLYVTMAPGDQTQTFRLIHYLTNKPSVLELKNNAGTNMTISQLPSDDYIIREDKLVTLSNTGAQIKPIKIGGKYKYGINLKWDSQGNQTGWHPRVCVLSDSGVTPHPSIEGQIRYYYTDN